MDSGTVFDIQHFCTHDGPGIRTTVFLKGCSLRCVWCHNPESQQAGADILYHASRCAGCFACEDACPFHDAHATLNDAVLRRERCNDCTACADACMYGAVEIAGKRMTAGQVMQEVLKDMSYYQYSGGGMTLSGGEPLFQPDFACSLLKAARDAGIHTAVETSGFGRRNDLLKWLPYTDVFLWDVKLTDETAHRELTQVSLTPIMDNLRYLSDAGADILLRILYIPDIHDNLYPDALAGVMRLLKRKPSVELIPYHKLGISKRQKLGLASPVSLFREPSKKETTDMACRIGVFADRLPLFI